MGVSEKISEKTKLKIAHKKKMTKMKPKAVIKVNSPQGKQMLRQIAKTGVVPFGKSSSSTPSSSVKIASVSSAASTSSFDEDDDGLMCPTCMSSFWYPTQTHEHMKKVH